MVHTVMYAVSSDTEFVNLCNLLLLCAARNAEYLAKARRLNSNKGIAISKGIAQWRFTPLQAAAVVALKQVSNA
jgi:hypothetical protein